jgi:hypothetical protein
MKDVQHLRETNLFSIHRAILDLSHGGACRGMDELMDGYRAGRLERGKGGFA